VKYFGMRLLFLTIPKPLKQYTVFKKNYPFRSPSRRLINKLLQTKFSGLLPCTSVAEN